MTSSRHQYQIWATEIEIGPYPPAKFFYKIIIMNLVPSVHCTLLTRTNEPTNVQVAF